MIKGKMCNLNSQKILCTSLQLHVVAENLAQDHLPSKSKKYYEAAYEKSVE